MFASKQSTIQRSESCSSDSSVIRNQSATALATWDTSLIEQAAFKILAQEAKLRAASLVLAPTCNIQRVSRLICCLTSTLTFENFEQNPLGG